MSTIQNKQYVPSSNETKKTADCPLCGEEVGELPDHIRTHCRVAEAHRRAKADGQEDLSRWSK